MYPLCIHFESSNKFCLNPEHKHSLRVGWRNLPCFAWAGGTFFPDGKKNRFVITTGKKKFQSSVWRVRNRYYDRKKKVLVVCLAGARSLLRPKKKYSSRLSGGCGITTISTTGPIYAKSSDFYAKLNVSNLNVTNLYQFYSKLI